MALALGTGGTGTDALYKSLPAYSSEPKPRPPSATYFTPSVMSPFDIIAPGKQVEESDRQLERARALFEQYRPSMNSHDRDLAQSLLDFSSDLRKDFEAKRLPTRIKQAQLYCNQVDEALKQIQAAAAGVDAKSVNGGAL